MNKVAIVGRLTRDVESRNGDNGNAIARFSVAVNRKFKNAEGNYEADFISCVAFGKTAEFIGKYFKKGSAIGLVGRIQTGNYINNDGVKVYTTDVVAEEVEFVESKGENNNNQASATDNVSFEAVDSDDELPFA